MRAAELVRFAATGLRGHGLRTVLSVLGVAIGVASVILLTSLGEGAKRFVTAEFTSLGSNLLIVIPGKTDTQGAAPFVSTSTHDLTVDDARELARRLPRLRRTAPVAVGTVSASHGERSRDVMLVGTTSDMLEIRNLSIRAGRYLPEGTLDAPVCVLGATVAAELFGSRSPLGEFVRLGESRYRVIGVTASKGTSVGVDLDEVVQVPVDGALRMFNRSGLFRILAEVNRHAEIETARDEVLALLAERHGDEDVTVFTQDSVLATFGKVLTVLTLALAGIAGISLTVAGIGIMNVMLVSVSERTREIGLLKALGVTRRQIVGVFLTEAAMISAAGGLSGLAVGVGVGALATHFYPEFPIQPPVWAAVAAVGVSAAVGLLFGSFPARNAARLDPVAALMRKRS